MAKKASDAAFTRFSEKFNKTFGDGTMQEARELAAYQVISTGSLLLDYATGVGGYVEGRLVEIWGADAVGKTSLSFLGAAQAQKKHPDKRVGFIDMEQTFDVGLATGFGVDIDRMVHVHPSSAEDVADAMKEMIRSGLFSFIILDSIGAMIPEVEKEKGADEATVAIQAKIVTRMVKIAAVEAAANGTVVVFINQVRANVGGYGPDTTTGGGFALKHVTTHKFKARRTGTPVFKVRREGEEHVVGHEIAVVVERNKVAPPGRVATLALLNQSTERYGPMGVDVAGEAVELGLRKEVGAIIQAGAFYTIASTGEKVQGRDALTELVRKQPDLIAEIRDLAIASRHHEIEPPE